MYGNVEMTYGRTDGRIELEYSAITHVAEESRGKLFL